MLCRWREPKLPPLVFPAEWKATVQGDLSCGEFWRLLSLDNGPLNRRAEKVKTQDAGYIGWNNTFSFRQLCHRQVFVLHQCTEIEVGLDQQLDQLDVRYDRFPFDMKFDTETGTS